MKPPWEYFRTGFNLFWKNSFAPFSNYLDKIRITPIQNELLKKNYDPNICKLIIFCTPGYNLSNGGIMSITSIYQETRNLRYLHGSETIMCTVPGDPVLLRYTKFQNNNYIYQFRQVLSYFTKVEGLIIHVPEYCLNQFIKNITYDKCLKLKSIKNLHINIMLQNLLYFERNNPPDCIKILKTLGKVTCTTAHEKYSTYALSQHLGIPLHKLSWFVSPEQYKSRSFTEKENLIIVSDDPYPKKSEILKLIAKKFPNMKIVIIKNLTYEQYKGLILRAKWALTFGEGVDNYFIETVFSGGISFALYKPTFFTEDLHSLPTVYDSLEVMAERITKDIEDFNKEPDYTDYQRKEFEICAKHFNYKRYLSNIRLFYEGKYTFP